jgi:hypothetical protein
MNFVVSVWACGRTNYLLGCRPEPWPFELDRDHPVFLPKGRDRRVEARLKQWLTGLLPEPGTEAMFPVLTVFHRTSGPSTARG